MADKLYPDAYVKQGRILDINTDDELCSYEGLVLADLAGRSAIMITEITSTGRVWDLVHWGPTLSTVEIQKYLKEKN